MKNLILLLLFSLISLSANAQLLPRCAFKDVVPGDPAQMVGDFEDVRYKFRYIKMSKSGEDCITKLYPSSNPDWEGWVSETYGGFTIYNEGKPYCLENDSTWEILRAGNSSPYHEMILRRIDKKEPHNARLSLIRDTKFGSLIKRYGWIGMKCAEGSEIK